MGLAAAQARLLSITSRMSDNELRAQLINNKKIRLSQDSARASERYLNALNNAKMMFKNFDADNNPLNQELTFNALTEYGPYNTQYGLVNANGDLLVSESMANAFEAAGGSLEKFLKGFGLIGDTTNFFDAIKNSNTVKNNTDLQGMLSQIDGLYTADDGINIDKLKEIYENFDSYVVEDKFQEFNNMITNVQTNVNAITTNAQSYIDSLVGEGSTLTKYVSSLFNYTDAKQVTTAGSVTQSVYMDYYNRLYNALMSPTSGLYKYLDTNDTNSLYKEVEKILTVDYDYDSWDDVEENMKINFSENSNGGLYKTDDADNNIYGLTPKIINNTTEEVFEDKSIDNNGISIETVTEKTLKENYYMYGTYEYDGSTYDLYSDEYYEDENGDPFMLGATFSKYVKLTENGYEDLAANEEPLNTNTYSNLKLTIDGKAVVLDSNCITDLNHAEDQTNPYVVIDKDNCNIYTKDGQDYVKLFYSTDDEDIKYVLLPITTETDSDNNEINKIKLNDQVKLYTPSSDYAGYTVKGYTKNGFNISYQNKVETTYDATTGIATLTFGDSSNPDLVLELTFNDQFEDYKDAWSVNVVGGSKWVENSSFGLKTNINATFENSSDPKIKFEVSLPVKQEYTVDNVPFYGETIGNLKFNIKTGTTVKQYNPFSSPERCNTINSFASNNLKPELTLKESMVTIATTTSMYGLNGTDGYNYMSGSPNEVQYGTSASHADKYPNGVHVVTQNYYPGTREEFPDADFIMNPNGKDPNELQYYTVKYTTIIDGETYYNSKIIGTQWNGDEATYYNLYDDIYEFNTSHINVYEKMIYKLIEALNYVQDNYASNFGFNSIDNNGEAHGAAYAKESILQLLNSLTDLEFSSEDIASYSGLIQSMLIFKNSTTVPKKSTITYSDGSTQSVYMLNKGMIPECNGGNYDHDINSDNVVIALLSQKYTNADGPFDQEGYNLAISKIKKLIDTYYINALCNTFGEPQTTWIDENDRTGSGDASAKVQWYTNLFNRMKDGYAVLLDGLASSRQWIEYALESGLCTMTQVNSENSWKSIGYANCADITEETDETAVTIAEAEYKLATQKIQAKDQRFDMELKNIDTEHTALQTEYDSIKNAMNENIKRTFKYFT